MNAARNLIPLLLATVTTVTSQNLAADQPSPVEQSHQAVQKSIPFIEAGGQKWIDSKKCVSCHRVGNMLWTLSTARNRGYQVSSQLEEWTSWAVEASLATNDKGKIVGIGNREGVAQLLLSGTDTKTLLSARQELLTILQQEQQSDGSWKPCGQLPSQKRPKPETTAVSTAWITLALLDDKTSAEVAKVTTAALEFINSSENPQGTEWHAVRLLLAVKRGEQERQQKQVETLLQLQHEDGSWGWLSSDPGDALGTGLALYALAQAGVDANDSAVQNAHKFLVQSQQDDGSWSVHGTKANRKDAVQETAVYWGTTWASLGLMAGLPDSPR